MPQRGEYDTYVCSDCGAEEDTRLHCKIGDRAFCPKCFKKHTVPNKKTAEEAEKYKCGCKIEGGRVICPTHFEPLEGMEKEVEEAQDIAHEQALDHAMLAYVKAVKVLERVKQKKLPIDAQYIEIKKQHERVVQELSLADVQAQAALSAIAVTIQLQSGIVDKEKASEKLAGIMDHVKKRIQQIAPQLQREEEGK